MLQRVARGFGYGWLMAWSAVVAYAAGMRDVTRPLKQRVFERSTQARTYNFHFRIFIFCIIL
jgi:hypothetical protein